MKCHSSRQEGCWWSTYKSEELRSCEALSSTEIEPTQKPWLLWEAVICLLKRQWKHSCMKMKGWLQKRFCKKSDKYGATLRNGHLHSEIEPGFWSKRKTTSIWGYDWSGLDSWPHSFTPVTGLYTNTAIAMLLCIPLPLSEEQSSPVRCFGLDHMACFGQWNVSGCDMSQALTASTVGFGPLCSSRWLWETHAPGSCWLKGKPMKKTQTAPPPPARSLEPQAAHLPPTELFNPAHCLFQNFF